MSQAVTIRNITKKCTNKMRKCVQERRGMQMHKLSFLLDCMNNKSEGEYK